MAFSLLLAITLPVNATDYTDIWWNAAESGQGYNFAQNGNFIFATFFVYGSNTAPTWYTGQLTLDATGKFTGPLYATSGPWFGTIPFNPAQVTISQVGSATFQPMAADTGVLTYNVGAVQTVKNLKRQTLVPIVLTGTYEGGIALNDSGCANPADNGPANGPATMRLTQSPTGQIQIKVDVIGIPGCTFTSTGPVTQSGQLFAFPATCAFADGSNVTAQVYELKATSLGIEGRWTAQYADGCHEEARFGGVLQY